MDRCKFAWGTGVVGKVALFGLGLLVALLPVTPFVSAAAEEKTELLVGRVPGLTVLPLMVAVDRRLIQKNAAALGLEGVEVNWFNLTGVGVAADMLLTGRMDVLSGGTTNMLVIWDKTNGNVRALAALSGLPSYLLTRNPNIRSIKDFGPSDRIAIPTLRQSPYSVWLGMALEQAFGAGAQDRLNEIQVQLGHPDAVQAILNPISEVNSHFSNLPYADIELRSAMPKVHAVLTSVEVMGGPATSTCIFSTRQFAEANPIKVKALIAALDQANEIIAPDPRSAALSYLNVTREKMTPELLTDMIARKDNIFTATPQRTMLFATYMARAGLLRKQPTSWKDYHFPIIHDRAGS
jgi:NitT/TauT family transport system substrate-binding protein